MADKIPVKIKCTTLTPSTYEFRTVIKGRFYKRQFIGYPKKEAIKLFEKWLSEQALH